MCMNINGFNMGMTRCFAEMLHEYLKIPTLVHDSDLYLNDSSPVYFKFGDLGSGIGYIDLLAKEDIRLLARVRFTNLLENIDINNIDESLITKENAWRLLNNVGGDYTEYFCNNSVLNTLIRKYKINKIKDVINNE